jgi:hypothetical protein
LNKVRSRDKISKNSKSSNNNHVRSHSHYVVSTEF